MKLAFLIPFLSVATRPVIAFAQTAVYGAWINGVFKGDGRGVYIRSPLTSNPIRDFTQVALACNTHNSPVPETLEVKPGDKMTFEWYHQTRGDNIIPTYARGPVLVYIAPTASNGTGPVWVKLYAEKGSSDDLWATDLLRQEGGHHSVIIPNLVPGDYLIRALIVSLHVNEVSFATSPTRGAQYFPSCTQIRVTGSGTAVLPAVGASFPNPAITPGTVTTYFDTFASSIADYTPPGPPPWSESAGGSIGWAGPKSLPWGQCGGKTFNGPTRCSADYICQSSYSQCVLT